MQCVAIALNDVACRKAGRSACVDAGAPAALVALAGQPAVKASADAAWNVLRALSNLAASEAGASACVAAGAPAALVALSGQPADKASADAAQNVLWALSNLAASEAGASACIAASAPAAIVEPVRRQGGARRLGASDLAGPRQHRRLQ